MQHVILKASSRSLIAPRSARQRRGVSMHACAATREPTAATQGETKRGVIAPAAGPFAARAAAALCAAGAAALRTQPHRRRERQHAHPSPSVTVACHLHPRILAPPSRLPCPHLISLCISRCRCPPLKQHGTRFKSELRRMRSNRRLRRISTPACARPPAPAALTSTQPLRFRRNPPPAPAPAALMCCPRHLFSMTVGRSCLCRKCGADVCKHIARALPRS